MLYQGRVIRIWAAGLLAAGIGGIFSPGSAGGQQVAAAAPPNFTFNLFGLINVANLTDVTLAVKPTSPSTPPPTSARQITLQAYDGKKLVSTKTYPNYPIVGGAAFFPGVTGLLQRYLLKAQLVLTTPGTSMTQVYSVDGRIFYRPDVEIQSASASSPVGIHHPVTINATIHEIKGDLGATFDVVLMRGSTVLDSELGTISVGPGGTIIAVLSTCFHELGTFTLTVKILKVNPTEWDPSKPDNQKDVTVTVVDAPLTPTDSSSLTYYNTIGRTATLIRDITAGIDQFDEGRDGNVESFTYFNSFSVPVGAAGFSVYVRSGTAELMSACIPLARGTQTIKPFPGGFLTEINYNISLNLDGTDYLLFSSSWTTDDFGTISRVSSSMTVSHNANIYVYFSAAKFFDLNLIEFTGVRTSSGALWQARGPLTVDMRVQASDGNDYGIHWDNLTISQTSEEISDPPTYDVDKSGHTIQTSFYSKSDTWFVSAP